MKLSKKEIQHIADLARLELTGEEIKIYGGQLSQILDYVNQLQEVDTTDIEPTAQVTGLENVWREDNTLAWKKSERESSLEQAPDMENNQIKVKRIL